MGVSGEVQCLSISILDDNIVEFDETFLVILTTFDPFVDIARGSTTVTIIDDDSVTIGWNPVSYTRNESDTVTICTEIVAGVIARQVTVFYSTIDGTAQSNLYCHLL